MTINQSGYLNLIIWGIASFSLGAGVITYFSPKPFRLESNTTEMPRLSTVAQMFGWKPVFQTNINEAVIHVLGLMAGDSRATVLVSISHDGGNRTRRMDP